MVPLWRVKLNDAVLESEFRSLAAHAAETVYFEKKPWWKGAENVKRRFRGGGWATTMQILPETPGLVCLHEATHVWVLEHQGTDLFDAQFSEIANFYVGAPLQSGGTVSPMQAERVAHESIAMYAENIAHAINLAGMLLDTAINNPEEAERLVFDAEVMYQNGLVPVYNGYAVGPLGMGGQDYVLGGTAPGVRSIVHGQILHNEVGFRLGEVPSLENRKRAALANAATRGR